MVVSKDFRIILFLQKNAERLLFRLILCLTNAPRNLCVFYYFDRVEGTGTPITVSTCHKATEIKVKFSVFTGSCARLECVSGTDEPDYACPLLRKENDLGEWNTLATAHTFETELDKRYYILVQGVNGARGEVWLNFRFPDVPQNDNCVDAIGPVPRDLTMIENSSIDATVSKMYDYCEANVPALYPGTWFQSKFFFCFVLLKIFESTFENNAHQTYPRTSR